jgi:type II secretory pathway pseudopilin PulG
MIELVFVIVVIGILSAVIIPRFDRDSLSEGAIQLASHIRYTQHLAMVDDKFMPNSAMSPQVNAASRAQEIQYWYLGRWQIKFSTANTSQSYIIMADSTISNYDGNPNASLGNYSEVAIDPLDKSKYLIGTTISSFDSGNDEHINDSLDLKKSYGINAISISGGSTGSTARRIIFDHLGRPYRGDTKLTNATRIQNSTDKLAQTNITVKLCKNSCTTPLNAINNKNERLISISPETGYVKVYFSVGESA